jgi:hypothetical protein
MRHYKRSTIMLAAMAAILVILVAVGAHLIVSMIV